MARAYNLVQSQARPTSAFRQRVLDRDGQLLADRRLMPMAHSLDPLRSFAFFGT